ncbi:MAG: beta-phosphoglucomutase [Flavobacteriaceae bacterium]|jgi:beta-phosphoglucomutase|nr:beta-phosphoglucomutase [Flavobacteriaceae bacterium]NVJ72603.1 beta-phosphoglucomutase [Flavobacteriaceae bacterium]
MTIKTKGFVFDLDGVLVDTAKYHYLAWKKFAEEFNYDFTEEENEEFKGVSRKRCLEILLNKVGVEANQDQIDQWLIQKNEDYLSYISEMNPSEVLPGVKDFLDSLKSKGIPMAVGSASKNAVPILEKVELLSYFTDIIDGNKVSKAKPDPEVFVLAAKALHVKAEDTIVFEDAIAGIQAANAAGMLSIGVGDQNVLCEADYNIENFNDITNEFLTELIG